MFKFVVMELELLLFGIDLNCYVFYMVLMDVWLGDLYLVLFDQIGVQVYIYVLFVLWLKIGGVD